MFPAWVEKYVGLPFVDRGREMTGCDCYGLYYLINRQEFGRDLPRFDGLYSDANDKANIISAIEREILQWWPTETPEPGDGVLLNVEGQPWHIGVYVAPGWMLHTEEKIDCVRERYDRIRWGNRFIGFYRYAG